MEIVNKALDTKGGILYLTATYSTDFASYRETGRYTDRAEAVTMALETDEYVLAVHVEELGRAKHLAGR